MKTLKTSIRPLLIACAIVPLASSMASAQYRVDNSAARDANNRIGSGGYNDSRGDLIINNRIGGLTGNEIVTGNVTGGRAFRGSLDYTDPTAFRGHLGSAAFDPFIRDSTGVDQIRGGYGNTNVNPQAFFGNRTVAPPPGFVQTAGNNGTYLPQGVTSVLPNDGRADFGGASRATVAQTLIDTRQSFGNAGFAPPTAAQLGNPTAALSAPLQLSEFTTLARQRDNLFGGTTDASRALNNVQGQNAPTAAVPGATPQSATPIDSADPANLVPDNRVQGSSPIQGLPAVGDTTPVGDTGQGLSTRSTKAIDNNSQYAALRDRLAQDRGVQAGMPTGQTQGSQQGGQPGANQPLNTRIGGGSGPIDQRIQTGGSVSTGQGTTLQKTVGTNAADQSSDKPDDKAGDKANDKANDKAVDKSDDKTPADGAKKFDGTNSDAKPDVTPDKPLRVGILPPVPADNLQLPHPDQQNQPTHLAPVQISSLATGVKDPKLSKTLAAAEGLMKAGKFSSAIDTYEHAEEMASDDPLVFVGRSIAELGGGYYRNAEGHLRQAYDADASLVYAKFDLRAMLGDDRLNTLTGNLSDIAGKNANDPGPLLLLAFIYYNGGMEDRAARALDMAQVRAGGKDHEVDTLRKTWQLDAKSAEAKDQPTKDQAPAELTK